MFLHQSRNAASFTETTADSLSIAQAFVLLYRIARYVERKTFLQW